MGTLTPIPGRTLIVLRNEAKAAREGSMVVHGIDVDMAELLEDAADEIERLTRAIEYAHSQGFEWPSDPLPVK